MKHSLLLFLGTVAILPTYGMSEKTNTANPHFKKPPNKHSLNTTTYAIVTSGGIIEDKTSKNAWNELSIPTPEIPPTPVQPIANVVSKEALTQELCKKNDHIKELKKQIAQLKNNKDQQTHTEGGEDWLTRIDLSTYDPNEKIENWGVAQAPPQSKFAKSASRMGWSYDDLVRDTLQRMKCARQNNQLPATDLQRLQLDIDGSRKNFIDQLETNKTLNGNNTITSLLSTIECNNEHFQQFSTLLAMAANQKVVVGEETLQATNSAAEQDNALLLQLFTQTINFVAKTLLSRTTLQVATKKISTSPDDLSEPQNPHLRMVNVFKQSDAWKQITESVKE